MTHTWLAVSFKHSRRNFLRHVVFLQVSHPLVNLGHVMNRVTVIYAEQLAQHGPVLLMRLPLLLGVPRVVPGILNLWICY